MVNDLKGRYLGKSGDKDLTLHTFEYGNGPINFPWIQCDGFYFNHGHEENMLNF